MSYELSMREENRLRNSQPSKDHQLCPMPSERRTSPRTLQRYVHGTRLNSMAHQTCRCPKMGPQEVGAEMNESESSERIGHLEAS
jgi:hypothetical protein